MDKQEAQAGLDTIVTARRGASELRNYQDMGSIICAWGIVWLTGFMSQQFLPDAAWMVWATGWVGALGWTMTRPRRPYDWKAFATWAVALIFIALLLTVIRSDIEMAGMVFALVLTASYAIVGVWAGKRFLMLAATVLASACTGWWLLPHWLFLVLALGGGAALIIGGQWIRRP